METSPAPQQLCDGITSKFQSAVITDMASDMQDQLQQTAQKKKKKFEESNEKQ